MRYNQSNHKLRILENVTYNFQTQCWIWRLAKAFTGSKRYGYIQYYGHNTPAHRVSYEIFKGKIPLGLVVDHLCRNSLCVNPDHLEAVTQQVNQIRGISWAAINAKKTHCPKGHAYTPENTYTRHRHQRGQITSRECRTCIRQRWKDETLRNRLKGQMSVASS